MGGAGRIGGVHVSALGLSDSAHPAGATDLPRGGRLVGACERCPALPPCPRRKTAELGQGLSLSPSQRTLAGGLSVAEKFWAAQHLAGSSQAQPHARIIRQPLKYTDPPARPSRALL